MRGNTVLNLIQKLGEWWSCVSIAVQSKKKKRKTLTNEEVNGSLVRKGLVGAEREDVRVKSESPKRDRLIIT